MLNNGRERSQSSTNVNSDDQNEGPNNSWRRNKSSRFAKQNQDQVSNRLDQLAFVLWVQWETEVQPSLLPRQ